MIVNADARRIPLADESAQCCVTSTPYFGLRDYGTAKWIGGDANCEHNGKSRFRYALSQKQKSNNGSSGLHAETVCSICGAVRIDNQIGIEQTPEEFVANIISVSEEVRRVLKPDGTYWLNIGDSYANDDKWGGTTGGKHAKGLHGEPVGRNRRQTNLKPKDLMMIPARVAIALQAAGWYLRAEIIWAKPNPMPESVTDRPTRSHEMIYLLTKSEHYFYDYEAVKEVAAAGWNGSSFTDERDQATKPNLGMGKRNAMNRKSFRGGGDYTSAGGYSLDNSRPRSGNLTHGNSPNETGLRNQRDVWTIAPENYSGSHYAVFPTEIPRRAIKAGSRPGDIVLDPFCGSGTTGIVCRDLGRRVVGLDLSMEYLREHALPRAELKQTQESLERLPLFGGLNA